MKPSRYDQYQKKLSYLKKYDKWLKDWTDKTSLKNIEQKKEYQSLMGIYHAAQSSVAVIIDVMAMLNKDLAKYVNDNYHNLDYLIEEEIIPLSLKDGIIKLIGLRNRLAHDYNGIIDEIAWESIKENINIFKEFLESVESWLKRENK